MLQLTSTGAVVDRIAAAATISAEAYTLHGAVLRSLEDAARRGASVSVRLEGAPFEDAGGHLARENARVAAELRAAGADAQLAHPLHAKALRIDGELYLDEKNWQHNDLVLHASGSREEPTIATVKHEALAAEAALLRGAGPRDDVIVESESFGCCNAVYSALHRLAREGSSPRLLVCANELRGNARERNVLEELVREGVRVRVSKDSEKLAVTGDGAWLGSANATVAFGDADSIDWGVCTEDSKIASAVRSRLEHAWNAASNLRVA